MTEDEISKITGSVRDRMAEINDIAFMIEFVLKRKLIAWLLSTLSAKSVIFFIVYLWPLSNPADFSFFIPYHREYIGLHSRIEKWMLFIEINYIDLDSETFGYILDHKEKPLIVSFGINIILQN